MMCPNIGVGAVNARAASAALCFLFLNSPLLWLLMAAPASAATVVRCPGPPVLYTDALTPEEAQARKCRVLEGAPVTIPGTSVQASGAAASGVSGVGSSRVDPQEQKARDADARRILEAELRREETRLQQALQDSRQSLSAEKASEARAAVARVQGDIQAIQRELNRLR